MEWIDIFPNQVQFFFDLNIHGLTFCLQQGITELGAVLLSLQLSNKLHLIAGPPELLHVHTGTAIKDMHGERNMTSANEKWDKMLYHKRQKTINFTANQHF